MAGQSKWFPVLFQHLLWLWSLQSPPSSSVALPFFLGFPKLSSPVCSCGPWAGAGEWGNVVHPLAVFGGRQGAGSSWCRISRYFSLSNGTQRIWHRLYVWKCRHCYHFDIYGMFFFVLFVFGFFWTGGAVRSQWSSFTFSSIFFCTNRCSQGRIQTINSILYKEALESFCPLIERSFRRTSVLWYRIIL